MSNSKGWLELGLIWYLNKRTVSSERDDKTREKDFDLLEQQTGKADLWGN